MENNRIHIIPPYLLQPTNPITVNVIGAGGTGSHMISALSRINTALNCFEHPGLQVNLFDDDVVTVANPGRQLFFNSEIGLNKAVALVNRYNRCFGTAWRAHPFRYEKASFNKEKLPKANITISCTDDPDTRFEIAEILKSSKSKDRNLHQQYYWMDFGNSRYTGQVILSTVSEIEQPKSSKFTPIAKLPFVTDEFPELLNEARTDNTPSCSLAEALEKQDLFINTGLVQFGGSLLMQMLREGMITFRGLFLNLQTFTSTPLPV